MPWKSKVTRHKHRSAHRELYIQRARALALQRQFGISADDYTRLAASQNGVCAICRKPETDTNRGRVKALAVDHNHQTKVVRGLLCSACNKAIGFLRDDPMLVRAVAEYLERASA